MPRWHVYYCYACSGPTWTVEKVKLEFSRKRPYKQRGIYIASKQPGQFNEPDGYQPVKFAGVREKFTGQSEMLETRNWEGRVFLVMAFNLLLRFLYEEHSEVSGASAKGLVCMRRFIQGTLSKVTMYQTKSARAFMVIAAAAWIPGFSARLAPRFRLSCGLIIRCPCVKAVARLAGVF
jgi:hypothetical protein